MGVDVEMNNKFVKTCGSCKFFMGGGDLNVCCTIKPDLYYENTLACNLYEELRPCTACEQYSECSESNCSFERIFGTDGCENFVRSLREL